MDLGGWNTDFDPTLLSVWSDKVDPSPENDSDSKDAKMNEMKDNSDPNDGNWDSNENQWVHLGVSGFSVEDEVDLSHKSRPSDNEGMALNERGSGARDTDDEGMHLRSVLVSDDSRNLSSNHARESGEATISDSASSTSGKGEDRSAGGSSDNSSRVQAVSYRNHSHMHPLAIQSSATCPAHSYDGTAPSSTHGHSFAQAGAPGVIPQGLQNLYGMDPNQAFESSNNSILGKPHLNLQVYQGNVASVTNQHLSSLAANFLLAQSGTFPTTSPSDQQPSLNTQYGSNSFTPGTETAMQSIHHDQQQLVSTTSTHPTETSASVSTNSRPTQRQSQQPSSSKSLPPFYLFDAPVELRANFMQNQRKLGLPIEYDPNSYHYGETVNGFHPQQLLNGAEQQESAEAPGAIPPGNPLEHRHRIPPQLIDSRHGIYRKNRDGHVKNEREQKRAQKITELIEQLRLQMEDGGWQVEARSKFHTLSSCAEYVKHMINTTAEKEGAVQKLKTDLELKQRKLEEDKAIQESRSDPESVTSSLTSDTTRSDHTHHKDPKAEKKRKASSNGEVSSSGSDSKNCRTRSSDATTEESSGEGRAGGSGTGSGSGSGSRTQSDSHSRGGKNAQGFSCVSDMTDSNRGSSSNNSGTGGSSDDVQTENDDPRGNAIDGDQRTYSSFSSDAAVASEKSSGDRHTGHKDVVFNNDKRAGRKRPPEEVTSLERSFELDYEEVFDKSNIPQLIATTSGKIVTWNECFVKATGYRKSDIERMTIFSLVRPDKLSSFFDIVAAALRPDKEDADNEESDDKDASNSVKASSEGEKTDSPRSDAIDIAKTHIENDADLLVKTSDESEAPTDPEHTALADRLLDYTAMTLPCINFPGMKKRNQALADSESLIDPLHVTITLMGDKDPKKRCFHCVFTNCRGTNGALGSITPELLASLYAKPFRRRTHYPHRHHHRHKRARIAAPSPEPTTSGKSQRILLQSAEISNNSNSDKGNDTKDDFENQSASDDNKETQIDASSPEVHMGESQT